ncbi:uncharacterized protein LOC120169045 [Hibiscus syriacus]|uniref:uncharacterized protein LOC120169045 n=1 Tax=Hibiscus syriacus TaxID=106335 RepID=UPI0019229980|nr:uncharacterized protein LOC120169045 [Hibiscus syriacus]
MAEEVVPQPPKLRWGTTSIILSKAKLLLIQVSSVEEKVAVLERTPWSFGADFLAIKDFETHLSLDEYDFSMLAIWLRIYNVPLGWMNREIGEELGNALGKLLAVDLREGEGRLGDFLRIRVELDCKSPLRRCLTHGTKADGQPRICPIKYERLPCFCHRCGIIGHSGSSARTKRMTMKGVLDTGSGSKSNQLRRWR